MRRKDEWLFCGLAIVVVCFPMALCELGRGDRDPVPLTDAPVDSVRPTTEPPKTEIQQSVLSPGDRYEAFVVAHSDAPTTWYTLHLADRSTGRVEQVTSDACYQFSGLEWTGATILSVRCKRLHDDCEPLAGSVLGVQIADARH